MALAQAAAYIRETNCSIAKYLLSYDTTWKVLMENESHPDFALREYDYRSVYTTWNVSFECVKQKNEDAAKMLQLWSSLDNKDIWYSLFNNKQNRNLKRWLNLPRWFRRVMGKDVDFREAVRILLAYSLIEAKEDSDAFAMHPVVHDWCRETLDASSRHEFALLAITVVGYAVPHRNERNFWELELRLLPHTSRCIALLDYLGKESLQEDDLLGISQAVLWVGHLFRDQLKFAEAEAMFQWALESDKKRCEGDVDKDTGITPTIHHSLGNLYADQKKLDKAEAMFQRALTGYEKSSGADTEDTMIVINNLGLVYERQGKLAEAEAMFKRALTWYTDTLGSDHVETADVVMNLSSIYSRQGNLTEAESLLKRALAVREDNLGSEHPATLETIFNLAHFYQGQRKFGEAEFQLERALSGYEKILGSEHTDTVDVCYKLGDALFAQEKFVEAGVHFERALSGYKKSKNYKRVKKAAVKLSRTYEHQGRLPEAEAILRPLLAEYEISLSPDHEFTLDACFQMGRVLVDQDDKGKLSEAETMLQRALLGYRKVHGLDHEYTAAASYNLGLIFKRQGKLHEAEDKLQQAFSGFKNIHGLNHESTVNTQYYLGLVLKDQGKLHEAEDILQQALLGHREIMGPDHQDTKEIANELSEIYKGQGRRKEAKALYNQYHDTTDSSRRFPRISLSRKKGRHFS